MIDPQPVPAADQNSGKGQDERGLYLYGIGLTPTTDERNRLDDVLSEIGVQVQSEQDLAAFYKSVPLSEFSEQQIQERMQDQEWLMRSVQHHHQIITDLAGIVPLLPATFGAVYGSEDTLRDSLRKHAETLREQLKLIRGCDEWALHMFRQEAGIRERFLEEDADLRRMSEELEAAPPGRAYLLKQQLEKRLSQTIESQQLSIADSMLERVSEFAVRIQVEDPRSSEQTDHGDVEIARASLLVPRARSEELLNALDHAADATPGIRVEVSGPWPAYSFSQIEPEEQT